MTVDSRFKQLKSFIITVPDDYDHDTQISTSEGRRSNENFYLYCGGIKDENYSKTTDRLVPGKSYEVKLLKINEVMPEDCLTFLINKKAMLVGAQGLSLVWYLKKDELPKDRKKIISLDNKDALWSETGRWHMIPLVRWESAYFWCFDTDVFEASGYYGHYLLCVHEVNDIEKS
jgi:hypothetical protein